MWASVLCPASDMPGEMSGAEGTRKRKKIHNPKTLLSNSCIPRRRFHSLTVWVILVSHTTVVLALNARMGGTTSMSEHTVAIQRCIDRLNAGDAQVRGELINVAFVRLQRMAKKMKHDFDRVGRWEQTDDILQNASLRL